MTKRLKHDGKCQSRPSTQVKTFHNHPLKFANPLFPLNNKEQKERFLTHGEISKFQLKGTDEEIAGLFKKAHSRIRFDLLGEAEHILNKVKEEYSSSKDFVENQFGPKISKEEATSRLMAYLKENRLDGCLNIIWCADMASSGSMQRVGPQPSVNKPEAQRYSMWIKNDQHNPFVRETGIQCLANHEIGTHFIRSFNDGLQPWYTDRERFGIRSTQTLEFIRTEEGLASLNTVLNARSKYLWGPALLYYTACKAAEMTFKQLFEHLTIYIDSPGQRWNYCMRVKRGLPDPNDIGGYGKDQCYFEGAVDILRNVDKIDFTILMSGKVCVDEILRIKRIARIDCIRLPAFMKKEERYKKYLRQIAAVNELHLIHPTRRPPSVYMHRVQMGYFLGKAQPNTQKSSRKTSTCWPFRFFQKISWFDCTEQTM